MAAEEKEVCPLCMEPMEADDLAFYPCDCRYQVCRFCWAKIINEENGLCPACRKEYNSEKPALYKPVSEAEDAKLKANRKRKENLKKTKLSSEMLKLLPELRVVQPNLIFVVGLPAWICKDKEVLKGSEYFGRYGKVFKVEINQNQTFGGPQGQPTFSAYITFCRAEDAMRSIKELDQSMLHGRPLRVSLGTTKYCSQFLRGTKCTKHECMYLHELGDPAASFTKEEMQAGKHTEYMNKLLKEFSTSAQQQSVSSLPSQLTPSDSTAPTVYTNSTDTVDSTTPPLREVTHPVSSGRGRTRSGGTTESPPSSKGGGYNGLHCKLTNGPNAPSTVPFSDSRRPRQCRTERPYSEFPPEGNFVWNRHGSGSEYISTDDIHKSAVTGKPLSHSYTHTYSNGLDGPDKEKFSAARGQHKSSGDGRRGYYHRSEHSRQAVPARKQHPTEPFHTSNSNSNCAATSAPISGWNPSHPPISNSTGGQLVSFGDDAVDIDFDPFRESQQGLAELLAAEVNKLVVTDEPPSHNTFSVNGHLSVQGREAPSSSSLPRPFGGDDSGAPPEFSVPDQTKQPWFANFAPPEIQELQTAGYKPPTTHSTAMFNSYVYPPPGFEGSARSGVHQSPESQSPMFSTSNLLDFGVGESPHSSGVSFNMCYNSSNLTCANGPITDNSSFSYSATLPSPTNRLNTSTHFETEVKSKTVNGPDSNNSTPLTNGAMFRPYPNSVDANSQFRPDLMRLDPQQVLSHLLATTFNAASGILNNTRLPPGGGDKSSSKPAPPPFDLAAFVNYLCRLSPLFSSLNPQLSSDWANGSGSTNRPPPTTNFPEALLDSSAVLSAAASILFPAAAAAQMQSKSNEFLSTSHEPQPPPSRQNDGTGLPNQGFPPGLSKPPPFLQQATFSDTSSEKGVFSAPYGNSLKTASELQNSDSPLTWQLDDPAIVSSQLTASASANQNQPETNWKSTLDPVSPVDLLQQIWRTGSNLPVFDGHAPSSYSNYAAAHTNSPNNGSASTSQRQTIRDSSLQSAPQTD